MRVQFHPQGGQLVAGYTDGSLRFIDTTGLAVKARRSLPAAVTALCYGNDGEGHGRERESMR